LSFSAIDDVTKNVRAPAVTRRVSVTKRNGHKPAAEAVLYFEQISACLKECPDTNLYAMKTEFDVTTVTN
jgi:hypothetical protein